jgi:NAD(P)-dependent dehydrogenase (short-subunit alcohol dehydrogenase family)
MGRPDAKVAVITGAGVQQAFGGLDILVNNAGITSDHTFPNLDERRWDRVLDANLRIAFPATLTAMPLMRNRPNGRPPTRGRRASCFR